MDFRVQAVDGYLKTLTTDHGGPIGVTFIDDILSSWSNVETIAILGEPSTSPPSQTATPPPNPTAPPDNDQPQQSDHTQPSFVFNPFFLFLIGTLVIASIVIAMVIVLLRRSLKPQTTTPNQKPH